MPDKLPTRPDTPKDITLGEIYRGQRRLEREFAQLSVRIDKLFEKNIPARIGNLEKWRDWSIRVALGTVIVGLLSLLFVTSGAPV